jgi:hypothetical protein
MKRTDLAKQKGLAIQERMKQAGVPDRFGAQSGAPLGRREQRELERSQGLVPFAVKLDAELVKQLQALAQERKAGLAEVVSELLRKGLGAGK